MSNKLEMRRLVEGGLVLVAALGWNAVGRTGFEMIFDEKAPNYRWKVAFAHALLVTIIVILIYMFYNTGVETMEKFHIIEGENKNHNKITYKSHE